MTTPVPSPSRRGIALMALSGLNGVALLGVSLWLITRASAQPPIMYLQMAIVGVRAFALGRAFFRYVGRLSSHDSAFRGLAEIRVNVFERLVSVGPLRLSGRGRGESTSTFVRDVDALHDDPLRFREPLWVSGIVIGTTLASVTLLSPPAGLILSAGTLVAVGGILTIDHVIARFSANRLAPLRAELYGSVTARVRWDALLRAFDVAHRIEREIARIDDRIARSLRGPSTVTAFSLALVTLLMGIVAVAIVWVHPVNDPLAFGNIPPTFTLVALISLALGEFLVLIPEILEARRTVVAARHQIDLALAGSTEAIESRTTIQNVSHINLRDVTARYPGSADVALAKVSFDAKPGDLIVVRGESGSGKSTLANVLAGFLPVETGSYELDGVDSRTISPESLRQSIGLCEQQPHIFAETLRHNLDFANEGASEADLWRVLDRVGLGDWARSRDGLETYLGESGALVSGGQAQRIALARVLLAERNVIVLDEPTANLEPALAEGLLRDILAATTGCVLIVLSHTPIPAVRDVRVVNLI